MCGIFGYIGTKDLANKIVFDGIKLLEYRGYDSWGVAVKTGGSIEIEKKIGKIGNSKLNLSKSNIGIGHTRWATHGGVTAKNAHPHSDCQKQIAVIHNGIIENFQALKDSLLQKGHKFISETDTEVAAHLIEEELKTKGFSASVKAAFKKFTGMNAIVVMNAKSSEIIAAKNGSPLVIGKRGDEYFLASDAVGILSHTNLIHFMEDNSMVILGNEAKVVNLSNGQSSKMKFQKLDWKIEKAEKGRYKHFFIKEIYEEPQVLENTISNVLPIEKLAKLIDDAFGVFLIACGSASYAAVAATYLFSKVASKHVNFSVGSEFKYMENFITDKTLVIPISQSGESIDVIEPVTRIKEQKSAKIAAIVNVFGSSLYRIADFSVMLNSGPEKAVVATKSFMSMISVIMLTAFVLAGKKNEGITLIRRASSNVKKILKDSYIEKIKILAQKIKNKQHVYIIGRGLSYVAALETSLKLKEASYIHAEAFPGGELKHGVIALIEKDTPCIVFAPNDETHDEIISNAQEIKARG